MHNGLLGWQSGAVAALAVLVFLPGQAGAAPADWWDRSWSHRKTVQVVPGADYGQEPAAVAIFTTGGALKADGSDLRVVTPVGEVVPCRIIACGFEDACTN